MENQPDKFYDEFKEDDVIVTYDPDSRVYHYGPIISKYSYNSSLTYYHSRKISWEMEPVSRDDLKVASKKYPWFYNDYI